MTEPTTHSHPAELYVRVLGGDEQARRALLACSAALQWDDEAARAAVALVAGSNGSTAKLVEEIKGLACVWHRWDGSWHLSDEVRTYLADRLEAELDAPTRRRLYEVLTAHADRRLGELSPDGPLATYRTRARKIESAYSRLLNPGRAEEGGRLLRRVWSEARGSAKAATCEAVVHLVPELSKRLQRLPDEVLFLRGMAAYRKGDRRRAEMDFRAVYENGRPGEIYATAAHLYGRLVRDRRIAEKALREGIKWNSEPFRQGQVWHSLGNLLSKERRRWSEAEEAYRKSLDLDPSPEGQGQVWHSLGNLLSKERRRWSEAEEAYRKSLGLLQTPDDQGQVWHSLGNLSKERRRWSDAEEAYRKSLELRQSPEDQGQVLASWADALMKLGDPAVYDRAEALALEAQRLDHRPKTRGVTSRVLADRYETQGEWAKAITALETLQESNRRLGISQYKDSIQERIDRLRLHLRASA